MPAFLLREVTDLEPCCRLPQPSRLQETHSRFASGFRGAMQRATFNSGVGQHAHHIFAQQFKETWEKLGINCAENGAWWEVTDHLRNAYDYNKAWERWATENASLIKNDKFAAASSAYDFARELAEKYGLKW